MIKTFQFRIKDKNTAKHLDKLSRAVNFVWNFCGDTQRHALKWGKRWPNNYAFHALSSGCSKELGLHSQTIQAVCDEYATRRKQHKKRLLRFRGKKSLGWIPFKGKAIKVQGDGFRYQGQCYRVWLSRKLDGTIKAGSFSQDARGRWYVNLQCEVTAPVPVTSGKAVGIDLGLRTLATMHDGVKSRKIARERFYKDLEPALADAQRRRDKKRVQRIHAKIANRRKDYLHKVSTEIANEYQYIFIGDVSSSKLVKTKMAKSVLDAGWGMLKTFVETKAIARGSLYRLTNEAYTTVTCNACLERTGPTGFAGLSAERWQCSSCNAIHERDDNSALLIRHRGLERLGK